jgi:hypothetical protein
MTSSKKTKTKPKPKPLKTFEELDDYTCGMIVGGFSVENDIDYVARHEYISKETVIEVLRTFRDRESEKIQNQIDKALQDWRDRKNEEVRKQIDTVIALGGKK